MKLCSKLKEREQAFVVPWFSGKVSQDGWRAPPRYWKFGWVYFVMGGRAFQEGGSACAKARWWGMGWGGVKGGEISLARLEGPFGIDILGSEWKTLPPLGGA